MPSISGVIEDILFPSRKLRRLAAQRSTTASHVEMVEYAQSCGLENASANVIYKKIQDLNKQFIPNFPVQLADTLADVYFLVGDDVVDLIKEIAILCGKTSNKYSKLNHTEADVVTVCDVVNHIANLKNANSK